MRFLIPILLAALAGCEADQRVGQPQPVLATAEEAKLLLLDNINGYTWTDAGGLQEFSAMAFNRGGEVVAMFGADRDRSDDLDNYQLIDGEGATVLPGLIDAHGHVEALGLARVRVDLVGTRSRNEALQRIADFASAHPEASWILGRGWNQVLWEDPRFPSAEELNVLGLNRPVWLRRVDGHAAWANTVAMQLAGVDSTTNDPNGGVIQRDEDGNATGIFIDTAMDLVEKVIPAPGRAEKRIALQAAMKELASLGITSVHDAGIDPEIASLYDELASKNEMLIRIYGMLSEATFREFGQPMPDDGRGFVSIRSIKAYLDGALGSRGAALKQPYNDDPGNTGLLFKSADEFAQLAQDASARGFQVNVHAIGDAANQAALDGFAQLDTGSELRHRIEHAQIVAEEDLARFGELGVIASMQPTHATSDKNMAEKRVGAKRILGGYAWRTLLDHDVVIAAGSDFPVEPANPFFGLHAAVTRQDREGRPIGGWYPGQSLTRAEALRVFTRDAAFAAHQEKQLGTLEPGKRADFILLKDDFFTVDEGDIWKLQVEQTWVNGRRVFQR